MKPNGVHKELFPATVHNYYNQNNIKNERNSRQQINKDNSHIRYVFGCVIVSQLGWLGYCSSRV